MSFKLETDADILFEKARAAIRKYGVDAVVANVLEVAVVGRGFNPRGGRVVELGFLLRSDALSEALDR